MVDGTWTRAWRRCTSATPRWAGPNTEDEDKEYLEAGKPHAEKALKAMLLLEAVRQQEEIKVTDEDVDERIEQIAARERIRG